MTKIYIFCLAVIFIMPVFSQTTDLKIAKSDTVKIKILLNNGEKTIKSNPEKALSYFRDALLIASQINDERRKGQLNTEIGNALSALNRHEEALVYDLEALRLAKKRNDDPALAGCLDRLCTVYFYLENYTSAIEHGLLSIKISEKIGNKKLLANTHNTIGAINLILLNYDKALNNFKVSLTLFTDLKDSLKISSTYDNIASIYNRQNKLKELLENAFMSLKIKNLIRDTVGKGFCYINIADAFYKEQKYDSSMVYYTKATTIFEKVRYKEPLGYIACFQNTANVYYDKKNFEMCLKYVQKAFEFCKEVKDQRNELYCYSYFAEIYEQTKNYKDAYINQKLYTALNDSLFNIDKSNQITEMQMKFDTEKKEIAIEKLTQENKIQQLEISRNWYLIIGLMGFVIFIIVIALLLSSQNKLKANQAKMEIEQKLFRSQMNPHFIFNALIAIQNYVYKHKPPEVAGYISNFAKLMRMILENSRSEYITVEKEISALKYYMELQQLRFQDKFDFTIEVDPSMEIESISIPPMLSQPFIENAIEHGIMNKKDGKGKIELKFIQHEGAIELVVKDNGVGIEFAKQHKKRKNNKHNSLATTITEERLAILNKKSKRKFELKIRDIRNSIGESEGTEVSIHIPES